MVCVGEVGHQGKNNDMTARTRYVRMKQKGDLLGDKGGGTRIM